MKETYFIIYFFRNCTLKNYVILLLIHSLLTWEKKLFIRSLQGKNSNIYLRIKKRGRIIDMRKFIDFKTTVFNCVNTSFNFYCQNDDLLNQSYFADFRLIKTNSGHHFHFICIYRDKYVNRFWERLPP